MNNTDIAFLRFLGWLLTVLMVTNWVLAKITYNEAPAYLLFIGFGLGWYLLWSTSFIRNKVKSWLSL